MIDFGKQIYDDFVNGDLVFIASQDQVDEIEEMIFSYGDASNSLVFRAHPLVHDMVFVGHRSSHGEWYSEWRLNEISSGELRDNVVLKWDMVEKMIQSLNEDSLEDIFGRVINARAYVNINPIGEDISDMIDLFGSVLEQHDVSGGHNYDTDEYCAPIEYIQYLYGDNFRNVFIDQETDDKELNASNGLGIGTDASSIRPSMVYPIAYLVKKDATGGRAPLYTEEDFSEIFN